uniref:Transmembrane protein 45B n=1 Tax=Mesocestoides corti TaxID=53468 RepID=A0A5K3FYA4_MESCO
MEEHSGHPTNHSATSQAISLEAHLSHSGLLPSHVYFGSCLFILGAWWFTGVLRTQFRRSKGVWFLQAGLVLDSSFSERWIEEDHTNLMFITIAFSWDMCGVVLFQIFFAAIMEKLCGGSKVEDHRQRLRTTEGARTIKDVNMNGVDEYKPLQTLESLESEVVLDAQ